MRECVVSVVLLLQGGGWAQASGRVSLSLALSLARSRASSVIRGVACWGWSAAASDAGKREARARRAGGAEDTRTSLQRRLLCVCATVRMRALLAASGGVLGVPGRELPHALVHVTERNANLIHRLQMPF